MIRVLFIFAVLVFSYPAFAEESVPQTNPVVEKARALSEGLDKQSRRHFDMIYGNYNMVRVVEAVRGSIGEAVEACGQENPDLKGDMDGRFEEWTGAVNPVLEEASANIDNMVLVQEYLSKKEFKSFFKLIDKTRKEAEGEVDKVPVTTEKACKALLKSMDKTQPRMVKLLRQTLISVPQRIQAEDEAERAKQLEDEQKAAAEEPSDT